MWATAKNTRLLMVGVSKREILDLLACYRSKCSRHRHPFEALLPKTGYTLRLSFHSAAIVFLVHVSNLGNKCRREAFLWALSYLNIRPLRTLKRDYLNVDTTRLLLGQ